MSQPTSSSSWVDIIQNDTTFEHKKLIQKSENDETNIPISDIIEKECGIIDTPQLLNYQTRISNYLRNYFDQLANVLKQQNSFVNNTIEKENIIKYLSWLRNSTSTCCSRNHEQPKIHERQPKKGNHINGQNGSFITRFSYKFCEYGPKCKFQYGGREKHSCYQMHFVFPFVHADIDNIIKYIEANDERSINISEVLISLNTISYVINHMKREMNGRKLSS